MRARNLDGSGGYSTEVTILAAQIPDAPTDLANVIAITSADSIGLVWSAPVFNGGSAVTDYRVWYDDATDGVTFTIVETSVTGLTYTATGLT